MTQSKELGTLVVVVRKARHLHQPSFYKQDPYAQAALSGQTQRTKPDLKGGQHPVWGGEFRFPVLVDPGKDQLLGVVDIESSLGTGEFDGEQLLNPINSMYKLATTTLDWVQLETSGGVRPQSYYALPPKGVPTFLSPDASSPPPGRSINPTPVQLRDPGRHSPQSKTRGNRCSKVTPAGWSSFKVHRVTGLHSAYHKKLITLKKGSD
ncbi:hypothetical protein AZE42_12748 [Rhizopogon vesiculosus]|uniref:C2 domain-containing protein n=1 Tax=Rhizopogon vesiculosus TaxID=180088 RepID=A0A1J8QDX5_9AGAM|nr:hypothetical protein AZE42_12748 [Rhizopogon vesiculosus]